MRLYRVRWKGIVVELAVGLWLGYAPAALATSLTGAVVFPVNNVCCVYGMNTLYDTIGTWNLYVTGGALTDPFLNHGDANPATRIAVPLVTGTYTFSMFAENYGWDDDWGFNLFFNGNDCVFRSS